MVKYRNKVKNNIDHGTRTFICQHCGTTFDVKWETIFAIQEVTHGYVGYENGDVQMNCPNCENEVKEEEFAWDTGINDLF